MEPFPIPDHLTSAMPGFTGRTWVLPRLLEWFEKDTSRHFVITGDPGTGKSMLSAWLAGYGKPPAEPAALQELGRLRGFIQGVHFCQFNTGHVTPSGLAQNLATQLSNRIDEFREILLASQSEQIVYQAEVKVDQAIESHVIGNYIELDLGNLEATEAFNRALRTPLIKLYKEGYQQPMLLLVDALDEAYGASDLVQILSGLTDLPQKVRLLVTTRNDTRVLSFYPKDYLLDLVRDCPPGQDDLQDYVDQFLNTQSRKTQHTLYKKRSTALAKNVASVAQGNFLYAHLAARELIRRLDEGRLPQRVQFPADLTGHYNEFFNRELGRDEDRWYKEYKPVLGVLAVSQGQGLERVPLRRITNIKEVDLVLKKCAQYLQPAPLNGPHRLFHKSLAEYLLDEPSNEAYHIDAYEMHSCISSDLYKNANGLPDFSSWEEYGMRYAPLHLAGASDDPDLDKRIQQARRLTDLLADLGFQKAYQSQVEEPAQMDSILALSISAVSRIASVRALKHLVKLVQTRVQYNQERQKPKNVLEPAEAGRAEAAVRELAVFHLEPYWWQAALLLIAWLAAHKKVPGAEVYLQRVQSEGMFNGAIGRLSYRVQCALDGVIPGVDPLYVGVPQEHVMQEIITRMAGEKASDGLIREYLSEMPMNPELLYRVDGDIQSASTRFLADEDAPLLVAFAIDQPAASEPYLRQYIDLHARNKYLIYRDSSLWRLAAALLSHPDQEFTLKWMVKILRVVLDRRGLIFEESLQAARMVYHLRSGQETDPEKLELILQRAYNQAQALQPVTGRNDQWGEHKRRLASLAEALHYLPEPGMPPFVLPGKGPVAALLLQEAFRAPRGFAGFMAPAWLTVAEAVRVCNLEAVFPVQTALDNAMLSAQKIQEGVFCARTTARVKGLLQWWQRAPLDNLPGLVESFAKNPQAPDFCARHTLGETYPLRKEPDPDLLYKPDGTPDESNRQAPMELPGPLLNANTLQDLAQAIHLHVDDFIAANPEMDPEGYAAGCEVNVPDPEFTPMLAAFLSSEVLVNQELSPKDKYRLVQLLVPPASGDPTNLYTVLARLVLVAAQIPGAVVNI